MNLNTGDGRQELQQARLLGVSGRVEEGVAAFEKLFGGVPPIRPSRLNTGRWWRASRRDIKKPLLS